MKEFKERIIIEIAGHDHLQDLRIVEDDEGDYRNLLIANGISVDHE
jgi:hypothetical protein